MNRKERLPVSQTELTVFQFTLTCSRRPIFICFVSVTGSSVAPEYPHLQTKVQQVFSKKLPVLPQSDGSAPTLISGLPPIQQFHTTFNHHKRLPGLIVVCFGRFWVRGLPFPNATHLGHPFEFSGGHLFPPAPLKRGDEASKVRFMYTEKRITPVTKRN